MITIYTFIRRFRPAQGIPRRRRRAYLLAREEGCKFYFGSDAHTVPGLGWAKRNAEKIIELLELKEEDKFII